MNCHLLVALALTGDLFEMLLIFSYLFLTCFKQLRKLKISGMNIKQKVNVRADDQEGLLDCGVTKRTCLK